MKIEEGDTVEVVYRGENFPSYIPIGAIGEVTEVYDNQQYPYTVEFEVNHGEYDEDKHSYFLEEELNPITKCEKHGKRLYNERKEEWFCPWCEHE